MIVQRTLQVFDCNSFGSESATVHLLSYLNLFSLSLDLVFQLILLKKPFKHFLGVFIASAIIINTGMEGTFLLFLHFLDNPGNFYIMRLRVVSQFFIHHVLLTPLDGLSLALSIVKQLIPHDRCLPSLSILSILSPSSLIFLPFPYLIIHLSLFPLFLHVLFSRHSLTLQKEKQEDVKEKLNKENEGNLDVDAMGS